MTALLAVLLAFLGWLAAGLANWAADRLPGIGASDAEDSTALTNTAPLAEIPPIAGTAQLAGTGPFAGEGAPAAMGILRPVAAHLWTLPWYPARRGICPHCGQRRPIRAPLVEVAAAALFLLAGLRFANDPVHLALTCLWTWFFLVVAVIDLEHRRVLNLMLIPAAVVAIAAGLLPGAPTLGAVLVGGAVSFAIFLLVGVLGRGKMGAGDVKLAGVIGLVVGWPGAWQALFFGIIAGGIGALALILARRAGRRSYIAYAPYLALGALLVLYSL